MSPTSWMMGQWGRPGSITAARHRGIRSRFVLTRSEDLTGTRFADTSQRSVDMSHAVRAIPETWPTPARSCQLVELCGRDGDASTGTELATGGPVAERRQVAHCLAHGDGVWHRQCCRHVVSPLRESVLPDTPDPGSPSTPTHRCPFSQFTGGGAGRRSRANALIMMEPRQSHTMSPRIRPPCRRTAMTTRHDDQPEPAYDPTARWRRARLDDVDVDAVPFTHHSFMTNEIHRARIRSS